jgi:hypothetical protein
MSTGLRGQNPHRSESRPRPLKPMDEKQEREFAERVAARVWELMQEDLRRLQQRRGK